MKHITAYIKAHFKAISNLVLFASLLLTPGAFAQSMGFVASVNRLQAPVTMADVITGLPTDLQAAPWPSHWQGWVKSDDVSKWLLSNNPSIDRAYEWKDKRQQVWVEWCYPVAKTQLLPKVQQSAQAFLAQQQVTVQKVQISDKQLPCLSAKVSSVRVNNTQSVSGSRLKQQLTLTLEDGQSHQHYLHLDIQGQIQVAVLTQAGQQHQALSRLDYRIETQAWNGQQWGANAQSPLRLKKGLAAGHTLLRRDLQSIPDVNSGQWVKVQLQHGSVSINTKGKAMASGTIGQWVAVQVEGSSRTLSAQIIAKGVVNVSV